MKGLLKGLNEVMYILKTPTNISYNIVIIKWRNNNYSRNCSSSKRLGAF